jgi:hypothetical protein
MAKRKVRAIARGKAAQARKKTARRSLAAKAPSRRGGREALRKAVAARRKATPIVQPSELPLPAPSTEEIVR